MNRDVSNITASVYVRLGLAGLTLAAASSAWAQVGPVGAIRERLVAGSEFVAERCLPPCACPTGATRTPILGSFVLTEIAPIPATRVFGVTAFHATSRSLVSAVSLRGSGFYRLIGDFVLTEEMNLQLSDLGQPPQTYFAGPEIVVGIPLNTIEIAPETEIVVCRRNTVNIVAVRTCFADLDDGFGQGWSDGAVGIEDLLYFLNAYSVGSIQADVDDGSGRTIPDGGVGIEDLLHYLTLYARGC